MSFNNVNKINGLNGNGRKYQLFGPSSAKNRIYVRGLPDLEKKVAHLFSNNSYYIAWTLGMRVDEEGKWITAGFERNYLNSRLNLRIDYRLLKDPKISEEIFQGLHTQIFDIPKLTINFLDPILSYRLSTFLCESGFSITGSTINGGNSFIISFRRDRENFLSSINNGLFDDIEGFQSLKPFLTSRGIKDETVLAATIIELSKNRKYFPFGISSIEVTFHNPFFA